MSKQIRTYNDLLAEKQRLKELLDVHRDLIKNDVEQLKMHVEPVVNTVSFAGKLFSRDGSQSLLGLGIDMSVELLVKKLFKSNWLARTFLPGLLRNISSHLTTTNAANSLTGLFKKYFTKKETHEEKEDHAGTEAVFNQ